MAPVMRKPAARAASGMRVALVPGGVVRVAAGDLHHVDAEPVQSRFSSGTLLTCSDQLHTPMASGSIGMVEKPPASRLRGESAVGCTAFPDRRHSDRMFARARGLPRREPVE